MNCCLKLLSLAMVCCAVVDEWNRAYQLMSGWFPGGWSGRWRWGDLNLFSWLWLSGMEWWPEDWTLSFICWTLWSGRRSSFLSWDHLTHLLHNSGLFVSIAVHYLLLQIDFLRGLSLIPVHPYSVYLTPSTVNRGEVTLYMYFLNNIKKFIVSIFRYDNVHSSQYFTLF